MPLSLYSGVRASGVIAPIGTMVNVYTDHVNTTSQSTIPANRAIVSLSRFCQEAGITPTTAWRWRRAGWLSTVNISGRQYLTGVAIADFLRRADAGEFAKEHKVPRPR